MVTLFLSEANQITLLEYMLLNYNIEYKTVVNNNFYGVRSPYLVVDGVPLDMARAVKYIKEHGQL